MTWAAAALEVGSKLLEFTLNDNLMDELIALADSNGCPEKADEWRVLQREARLARAELDRTEALTQAFLEFLAFFLRDKLCLRNHVSLTVHCYC